MLILSLVKDAKRTPNGWQAKCPAHEDNHASLTIAKGTDGRALIKCQAGCTFTDVCAALKLKPQDFFVTSEKRSGKLGPIVAIYKYIDEDGNLLYEKTRHSPKDFLQRRPDCKGGWIWKLDDIRR